MSLGDFTLELDFELLTKQKLKNSLKDFFEQVSIDIDENSINKVEDFTGSLSQDRVPYEISTPPLSLENMEIINNIVKKPNQNKAVDVWIHN